MSSAVVVSACMFIERILPTGKRVRPSTPAYRPGAAATKGDRLALCGADHRLRRMVADVARAARRYTSRMSRIADLRKSYERGELDESHTHPDSLAQSRVWFDQALRAELPEPNAKTVATVGEDGRPSTRV